MIDLGLFCEVTPSEDGASVAIGAGAKWMDVSKILDEEGLAVVGGRNSAVGVGGLTLGGKFLLFTSVLGKLLLHTPNLAFITFSYPKLLNHTPHQKKGYDSIIRQK